MKKLFYHGTSLDNLNKIIESGKLKSMFEGIYFTDSVESAVRWQIPKIIGKGSPDVPETKFAVIVVELDENDVEPGMDHSPMMNKLFGVGESYLYIKGDIPAIKFNEILEVQIELNI